VRCLQQSRCRLARRREPIDVRLCVHRGTSEIGGNCIEVEAAGKSILLDLGMPLMGDVSPADAMPPVPGLTDGTNPDLLAVVISHPHADHYGLASEAHPNIPVYIGAEAHKLLRAAVAFTPFGVEFPNAVHYRHGQPLEIGPFRLTPYLVDHSAFDAHALLVEADGKRLFYSGDLRGHGWKSRRFDDLVTNGPANVDLMLLEGTTLGREGDHRSETEAELVERIAASIAETRGMVLAAFAGQNIDRFVTFFKAARRARRSFVVDLYLAHLLRALGRKSLPDPTSGALRVYLPRWHKMKIVRDGRFDLVEPYRARRIYPSELRRRQGNLVMCFRNSIMHELTNAKCLGGARLIYSLWPGYLERSEPDVRSWCSGNGIEFEVIHTSGHADAHDLHRLVEGINPWRLVPIHTLAADRYPTANSEILHLADGEWLTF
jgi:ribonuclease J